MKTLLLALISPGKSNGTREGAIRGLVGVGTEAIRKGLVEGGGAKVVAAEWESEGAGPHSTLLNSAIVGFGSIMFILVSFFIGCFASTSARVAHVRLLRPFEPGRRSHNRETSGCYRRSLHICCSSRRHLGERDPWIVKFIRQSTSFMSFTLFLSLMQTVTERRCLYLRHIMRGSTRSRGRETANLSIFQLE